MEWEFYDNILELAHTNILRVMAKNLTRKSINRERYRCKMFHDKIKFTVLRCKAQHDQHALVRLKYRPRVHKGREVESRRSEAGRWLAGWWLARSEMSGP